MTPQPQNPLPETVYISFNAQVAPQTIQPLLALCAQAVTQQVKKVYLLLSTPGGDVQMGMTAYNMLKGMPFELITHNVGAVNSIGNVIFLAGEKRYCVPHSTFMFHGVGFNAPGDMRFEEKFLRERLDSVVADQKQIGAVIVDRTKISSDAVKELFREAKTKDPAYALDNGIVHKILDVKIPAGAAIQQLVFQR